ncbi:MAG: FAD-dependent oxidoreductase [Sciscionella sp.]
MGTEVRADVAVVGAGVVGLAAAHELLARGHTVAVIGPRPGRSPWPASAASGAMLSMFSELDTGQPEQRTALEVGYRCQAHQRYPNWLASIEAASGSPVDLVPGTWVVAAAAERATLDAISTAARAAGHPAELHTGTDVSGLAPDVPAAAALWLASECSLDSAQLLGALGCAVGGHRSARWNEDGAMAVDTGAAEVRIRCGTGATVVCDQVVLAAGIGIPALLPDQGAELGVPPLLAGRGVSLLLSTPIAVEHTVRTPNAAFACGTHLVPRAEGTVYLGATNRLTVAPRPHPVASLDEIAVLVRDATTVLDGGLGVAGLYQAQVGYRPYTLDHLPLIGPTADPRILLATATYRCGVLLAPLLAELLADEITTPGMLAGHPYRAARPMSRPGIADLLTAAHVEGLVEHLRGPAGHLSAAAHRQLAAFFSVALHGALATDTDSSGRTAMTHLFEQAPVVEVLPSLLALAERLEVRTCSPPSLATAPAPIPSPQESPPQPESVATGPTHSPGIAGSTSSASTPWTASR